MTSEIESKFTVIFEAMDVPVLLVNGDNNKLQRTFNMNAVLSKFVALMVYSGLEVSTNISPSYTRINADIDYWKRNFEEKKSKPSEAVVVEEKK